jgi:N-acetyltransferase
VLSAPKLPEGIQDQTKIFLFITSSAPPTTSTKRSKPSHTDPTKERIVGVVVAQGIKWAMRVLHPGETLDGVQTVDSGGGVICEYVHLPSLLCIKLM